MAEEKMTEANATHSAFTEADFELYLMEYIYDEPMPSDLLSQMQEFERNHGDYHEICQDLREAKLLTETLPDIEVPERLNQKVLDLAKQPAPMAIFPSVVEPIGWAAAAAVLLSCGYLFGMMSTNSHDQAASRNLAQRREMHHNLPGRTLMAADVAAVFEHIHKSAGNSNVKESNTSWGGLRKVQAFLPQAERCLELYRESNDVAHLELAEKLIDQCFIKVRTGGFDGILAINSEYKSRLKSIKLAMSEVKLQSAGPK